MATAAHQQFSLKWNNYSQHIVTALEELRVDDELTDVTLSCDGQRIKAHKLLLSACSVFFKETFKENPCKHPVVILKGVSFQDLQAVVHFMYNGQVNVTQERLPSFLQTAEILHIKGLTENANEREETSIATQAPVKKRAQTFPNQASSDSGRLDGDPNRPPTPKRKKVIGSTGGAFASSQAQNSELPGTASVISTSGAAAGSAGAGNGNASQLKNNTQSSHPPALLAHNSDNSTDGLALVKYEEGDVDEEYDRTEENDHSFQDNGKDNGDSNSLGCHNRTSGTGERRPRYTMQPSNDLSATGVVDATNVSGRYQQNGMSPRDLTYERESLAGGENTRRLVAYTNGVTTNGTFNSSSKLRNRLTSRSLSSGGTYHYPQQEDRVIKYAPLQSHVNNSSHDSRSNSSHEEVVEGQFIQEVSESPPITDDEDEEHTQYRQKQPPMRRLSTGSSSSVPLAHSQHQKVRVMPQVASKSNGTINQPPINYRSSSVVNGVGRVSSGTGPVRSAPPITSANSNAEDLSISSPGNDISTPSFSLTQQLLQQNVLSLISSSNGTTEVIRGGAGGAGPSASRVSAIAAPSSVANSPSGSAGQVMGMDSAALPPYVCDVCGKRYVHHRSLNDHKKSHTGATRCPVCNKSFSKVANMRAHFAAQHATVDTKEGAAIINIDNDNQNVAVPPHQQNGRMPVKQIV